MADSRGVMRVSEVSRDGRIVTFYSFKGGVGRTMALANVAWILASSGRKVLTVDWDLESPGLHRYFAPFLADRHLRESPGMIDALREFVAWQESGLDDPAEAARITRYARSLERYEFPGGGSIDFVPPGRQDPMYSNAVATFNWDGFYDRHQGAAFVDALAADMRRFYDVTLVDSRTGLSDYAGICTVQLPDVVVDCFTLNAQGIEGAAAVGHSIHRHRQDIQVFPVPMRVDGSDPRRLDRTRRYARMCCEELVLRLGYPDPDLYWNAVEIPNKAAYAYEETLAVFGDPPGLEDSLLAAYERLSAELVGEPRPRPVRPTVARSTTFRPILSQPQVGPQRPAVFISYVREDYEHVERLARALHRAGIAAWLDRANLMAGDRWIHQIRSAIENGDFFLACFSPSYENRRQTYMNEELRLAIGILRQHPVDRRWFIPVKLGACRIPAFDIGPGEALDHLHHIDLSADWDEGIAHLVRAMTVEGAAPHAWEVNRAAIAGPAESTRLSWLAEFEIGVNAFAPVLIAYAPRDRIWAEWIASQLRQVGQRSILHDLIAPATLDGVSRAILLLSPDSVHLAQTQAVWRSAIARELATPGRFLVPARMAGFRLPPPFDEREHLELFNITVEHAREALIARLGLRRGALPGSTQGRTGPRFPAEPAVVWRAPARNAGFAGRDAILELLRERLSASRTPSGIAVLEGPGGIGKTQIALEYVQRFAADYDIVWWISAYQPALIRAALADLAAELRLLGFGVAERVEAVLQALRRGEPSHRWLLVLDNARHPDQVREFLSTGRGDVIITTSGQDWARESWTIEVGPFRREESVDFLTREACLLSAADADAIAERLGDLPLALAHAAKCLSVVGLTPRTYLDLVAKEPPPASRDGMPPGYYLAARSWRLGQKLLHESSPAAAYLLELLAFFAPEPIPGRWMESSGMVDALAAFDPALRDPQLHPSLVRAVNRYGLLVWDPAVPAIRLHQLLKTMIREELPSDVRQERRRQVHAILAGDRRGDPEQETNWRTYRDLRSHIEPSGALDSDDPRVHALVIDVVRYLRVSGDPTDAEELAHRALAAWAGRRAEDRLTPLRLRMELASTLDVLGRSSEARAIWADVASELERQWGGDHPYTLMARGGLAAALRGIGDYRAACDLDASTLAAWRTIHGSDQAQSLCAATRLAHSYRLVGAFQQALELNEDTLRRREKVSGHVAVSTLQVAIRYGRDLRDAGRLRRSAEQLESTAAAIREHHGADHPLALAAARSLAVSYRQLGHLDQADELASTAARDAESILGPRHQEALACTLELAALRSTQQRHDEAHALAATALDRYRAVCGTDHPHTLAAANNLAVVLMRAGRHGEARALIDDTAQRLEKIFGPDHPHTVASQMNLATALLAAGTAADAARLDEHCHGQLLKAFKPEHPTVLGALINLAITRRTTGATDEAGTRFTDALVLSRRTLGSTHTTIRAIEEGNRICIDIEPG